MSAWLGPVTEARRHIVDAIGAVQAGLPDGPPGSDFAALPLSSSDANSDANSETDLALDWGGRVRDADLIPAAVLVPLVMHTAGVTVLLTQRTANLRHHPNQISFPGGHIEADDASAEAAALREAEEEIGLHEADVQIVGRLAQYQTGTGFEVTPVVGLVEPRFSWRLDETEVAEVFEVPLSFVMDPENHPPRRPRDPRTAAPILRAAL